MVSRVFQHLASLCALADLVTRERFHCLLETGTSSIWPVYHPPGPTLLCIWLSNLHCLRVVRIACDASAKRAVPSAYIFVVRPELFHNNPGQTMGRSTSARFPVLSLTATYG